MVRIKHRYLLVNILYPELETNPKVPDILQFHRPTTNNVTAKDLLRGVRIEVDNLFGDFGAGSITDSSGEYGAPAFRLC